MYKYEANLQKKMCEVQVLFYIRKQKANGIYLSKLFLGFFKTFPLIFPARARTSYLIFCPSSA